VSARTAIVSRGMPTFHHVAVLFVWASRRTLRKLSAVRAAMSPMATATPVPVRTCWPWLIFIQPLANE
jgi:hypothetical protein